MVGWPCRFKHNVFVNGDPPVRFYCGTPLIASNGHRLGTLCFADHEPHTFDAERCNILNNMAELCVREIEREYMLRAQAQEPSALELVTPLLLPHDCICSCSGTTGAP